MNELLVRLVINVINEQMNNINKLLQIKRLVVCLFSFVSFLYNTCDRSTHSLYKHSRNSPYSSSVKESLNTITIVFAINSQHFSQSFTARSLRVTPVRL